MKITHIILADSYYEGYGYQENSLTKYHKIIGNEVSIITSFKNGDIRQHEKKSVIQFNENGIKTIRLSFKNGESLQSKFKTYHNLKLHLEDEKPDVIFVHGTQFIDVLTIVKYLKENSNVKAYADNHADLSNSALSWISLNILHKIIWRITTQKAIPFFQCFYGVTPGRVDFLKKIYKIPEEKLDLLVMGSEDMIVEEAQRSEIALNTRLQYSIKSDDFMILTGGKINQYKYQVLHLMDAVRQMDSPNVKLVIFGRVEPEMEREFNKLNNHPSIIYVEWLNQADIHSHIGAADLVVFPGLHSVLWENTVAMGTPLLVKDVEGTHHIDIGGNCKYLKESSSLEIKNILVDLVNKEEKYQTMWTAAKSNKRKKFLYSEIAKYSLHTER